MSDVRCDHRHTVLYQHNLSVQYVRNKNLCTNLSKLSRSYNI